MRFVESNSYKDKADQYAILIGYLLTKTGPIEITASELSVFADTGLFATAIPQKDGVKLVLLDYDELESFKRTGVNPRD